MKNRFHELRSLGEWSQSDLADKLGVSRQTINAIETERYDPSLTLAFKAARLFKLAIETSSNLTTDDSYMRSPGFAKFPGTKSFQPHLNGRMERVILRVFGVAAIAVCLLVVIAQMRTRARLQQLERQAQSDAADIARLSETNDELSKTVTSLREGKPLRTPAPTRSVAGAAGGLQPTEPARSNHWGKIAAGDKLSLAQVEEYLKKAGRSAHNLLAAFRSSGDAGLLREAMQKYPNDPQVAFEAVINPSSSPEERAQWLNALKQSAPDNALPNYLAALDAFKAENTSEALQELSAAAHKPQFNDFTLERTQNDQDLYFASGYSLAESKLVPTAQLLLPQLAQLKDLGNRLTDLANSYRSAGDEASAKATLDTALQLANRYVNRFPGEPEISRLVGMAIEYKALQQMDPATPYGDGPETVQGRMTQIDNEREDFKSLNNNAREFLPQMSDQDLISYIDHRVLFGEPAALKWVLAKYGPR